MCGAHGAVRVLLGEMISGNARPTVVDIEAGLEHLSRGTARGVETMLVVFEPYFKSMETGARMAALAHELGIPHVFGVANKVTAFDGEELAAFCRSRGIDLIASIPRDDAMQIADRRGVGPLDLEERTPAIEAIQGLADRLSQ